MNPVSILIRVLGGQARNRKGATLYFALATTGYRFIRRIMVTRQRTLLRFEVKPGEVFEIRGLRRGR